MKSLKRILFSAFIVSALCLGFFVAPGLSRVTQTTAYAAPSPKKAAQQLLKGIKKCDDKTLNKFVKVNSGTGYYANIAAKSKGLSNYIKKANKKMSYKIKKVKVGNSGLTAQVKVTATIMNSQEFADNVVKEYGQICTEMANGTLVPTSDYDFTERLFSAAEKNTNPSKKKKITLTLNMAYLNGRWVLTNASITDKFYALISANIPANKPRIQAGFKSEIDKLITFLAQKYGLSEAYVRAQFQPVIDKINQSV